MESKYAKQQHENIDLTGRVRYSIYLDKYLDKYRQYKYINKYNSVMVVYRLPIT